MRTYQVTITGTDITEVCADSEEEAKEIAKGIFEESGWDLKWQNCELDTEMVSEREL